LEKLEVEEDSVAMVGYRVNGWEQEAVSAPVGVLIADFRFSGLQELSGDLYGALLLVDCDRKLRLEPRKIHVRELLAASSGDLVDLYQDLLQPTATYISEGSSGGGQPKVFLSYAGEDEEIAEQIFVGLRKRGVDVWKDRSALRIGERYEDKIDEAIERADFAIVCLSSRSISKSGFVAREFRRILETP